MASALSPGGQCILSPPPSQPLGFLGASRSAISGVPCVSSGELISGCDPPGRCQPSRLVSNWEPACSLVEDAISGAEITPRPPALAITCLPLCLWPAGDGPVRSQLALLWYSISPLFCEQAWQCLRLEIFAGKFSSLSLSFFSSSLWLSHSLGCYLKLVPSVGPQGIQAQSSS